MPSSFSSYLFGLLIPLLPCSLLLQSCASSRMNALEDQLSSNQPALQAMANQSFKHVAVRPPTLEADAKKEAEGTRKENQPAHKKLKQCASTLPLQYPKKNATESALAGNLSAAQQNSDVKIRDLNRELGRKNAQLKQVQHEITVIRKAYNAQLFKLEEAKDESRRALEETIEENESLVARNKLLSSRLENPGNYHQALNENRLQKHTINNVAFGKKLWEKFLGSIEKEPPLPTGIMDILHSECPFWPGKRVKDTHFLVLIPHKVNGRSFSLNALQELIKHAKSEEYGTRFYHYDTKVKKTLGIQTPPQAYWTLMTRDIIPKSQYNIYENQCVSISNIDVYNAGYITSGALELATVVSMHYIHTGYYLYRGSNSNTDLRVLCRDFSSFQSPVLLGISSGLGINFFDAAASNYVDNIAQAGVVCSRRL